MTKIRYCGNSIHQRRGDSYGILTLFRELTVAAAGCTRGPVRSYGCRPRTRRRRVARSGPGHPARRTRRAGGRPGGAARSAPTHRGLAGNRTIGAPPPRSQTSPRTRRSRTAAPGTAEAEPRSARGVAAAPAPRAPALLRFHSCGVWRGRGRPARPQRSGATAGKPLEPRRPRTESRRRATRPAAATEPFEATSSRRPDSFPAGIRPRAGRRKLLRKKSLKILHRRPKTHQAIRGPIRGGEAPIGRPVATAAGRLRVVHPLSPARAVATAPTLLA